MLVNLENLVTIEDEKPPESLIPWLHCQTSLTSKLYSIKGEARLQVLSQIWKKPAAWEKKVLGLANDAVLQREILVLAGNKPYWYGRTLIPYQTYEANKQTFLRLEKDTLWKIIYGNPDIKRIMLLNYAIDENCPEYYWIAPLVDINEKILWLRFSLFTINEAYFCLNEILLPELSRI